MKYHQHQPRHYAIVSLSLTLGLTLLSGPLFAFEGPNSSNPIPLERRDLQFLPDTPSSLGTSPTLPPLPKETPQLSALGQIQVNQFKFEGNTAFSEAQLLQAIPSEYKLPSTLSAEQLQDIKNKLTLYYVDNGYINSGAIIPDQEVRDGVITFKLVEGKLVDVQVKNNHKLRSSYFQNRIIGKEGEVLKIETLQDRLQLLQQNPLLKSINAELGPGVQLGEGVLKLEAFEDWSEQIQFTFNNHRSPSVGAYRGEIELWERNFTGLLGKPMGIGGIGDTLYLRYGLTDGFKPDTQGLQDGGFRYDFPWMLANREITLSVQGERSDSDVVENPFKQIEVASKADTYGVSLFYPLWEKTPSQELNLGLKLEKRSSKTYLLGRLFSFSQGVQDGESKLTVIRFSQDWVKRTMTDVYAVRSVLSQGIDALDATHNTDGSPDGKFFTWLGQAQWVGRLSWLAFNNPTLQKQWQEGQIIVRTDFQKSWDPLLPLEKLSMGGANTVRGYRENILTHDNGVISSVEMRFPFPWWRPQLPGISKVPEDGLIQFALFADYGRAWDKGTTLGTREIYSAGLGLRWTPSQKSHLEVYWAPARRELSEVKELEKENPQDKGWHFEASFAVPF